MRVRRNTVWMLEVLGFNSREVEACRAVGRR